MSGSQSKIDPAHALLLPPTVCFPITIALAFFAHPIGMPPWRVVRVLCREFVTALSQHRSHDGDVTDDVGRAHLIPLGGVPVTGPTPGEELLFDLLEPHGEVVAVGVLQCLSDEQHDPL